jgi:ABC-2 type transport system permease protein
VGISYAVTSETPAEMWRMTGYSLVYLPAVLLLAALAVLLIGWLPRAAGATWGVLAVCFVVGYLGGLLDVPDWLYDLSPFSHTPAVPNEPLAAVPLAALTALVAVAAAVGYAGFRRRDVV